MYVPDPAEEARYQIHHVPTIAVIERPAESYREYHERKKKEEEAGGAVPFGFSRVLKEDA